MDEHTRETLRDMRRNLSALHRQGDGEQQQHARIEVWRGRIDAWLEGAPTADLRRFMAQMKPRFAEAASEYNDPGLWGTVLRISNYFDKAEGRGARYSFRSDRRVGE